MYEEHLFKDGKAFLDWARENADKSTIANDMIGWNGKIRYLHLAQDMLLLYQMAQEGDSWVVCDMHMLLWGVQDTLRKDICRTDKFWKAKASACWHDNGNILWHSSVVFGGRRELPFAVTNAWQEENFRKYSQGGCFEMTFAGIGTWMECMNSKGVIRFYTGNIVEMTREEANDPTIAYKDMVMSELRSLNGADSEKEPALVEFTGIVESCRVVRICGVKCYRITLWSGAPADTASFPWSLLIADSRIDGSYVPRVGDSVHGNACMFGTFHGGAQDAPTVFADRKLMGEEAAEGEDEGFKAAAGEASTADADTELDTIATGEGKDWEWLPRGPASYPEVPHHGGGLVSAVGRRLPKFVVYAEYTKRIKGTLRPIRQPSRKELRRVINSIDYVITVKGGMHVFTDGFDSIGIRHFVLDVVTGERHLWCGVASGFGREHFHTNILIALDGCGNVLRYTLYMGMWDWRRLNRGMSVQINFQTRKQFRMYDSIAEAIPVIVTMQKDDYVIACDLGHTAMLQAYCDGVVDGAQRFRVEWQIHYLPWQFYRVNETHEAIERMMDEFDKNGIEAVETIGRWKWCKMIGNV